MHAGHAQRATAAAPDRPADCAVERERFGGRTLQRQILEADNCAIARRDAEHGPAERLIVVNHLEDRSVLPSSEDDDASVDRHRASVLRIVAVDVERSRGHGERLASRHSRSDSACHRGCAPDVCVS